MRRRLAAVGVLASALCLAIPAVASAHLYSMSVDCDEGLRINLTYYTTPPEGQANTVVVIVDGNQIDSAEFENEFSRTYDLGSPFKSHSVEVQVRAWDDENGPNEPNQGDPSWSFDWTDSIDACQEPTPEPTPKRTPKPTPKETDRPHRTPRPTPKATDSRPPAPTIHPNLDLPPTDTAGDFGMTSGGDNQGAGQGILFLLAVMAAAGSTYGIRTVRRRAAAKR